MIISIALAIGLIAAGAAQAQDAQFGLPSDERWGDNARIPSCLTRPPPVPPGLIKVEIDGEVRWLPKWMAVELLKRELKR